MLRVAPPPTADEPPSLLRRGWGFARDYVKDKTSRVAAQGAKKGAMLAAQGVAGFVWLLTLPLLVQPLVVVGCCALIGVGLSGLRYGAGQAWKTLENVTEDYLHIHFMRGIRRRTIKRARIMKRSPAARAVRGALGRFGESVAASPRFRKAMDRPLMKNLMASRVGSVLHRHGLTQRQRELLLAGLTVQGSLATIALVGYGLTAGGLSLPFLTVGGIAAASLATFIISGNVWSCYCGARNLKRHIKSQQDTGVEDAGPALAPSPVSGLTVKEIAADFNSESVQSRAACPRAAANNNAAKAPKAQMPRGAI
jgi:hypothetical protein